ncbi:MAG: polyprenyl synthetase family protein [Acidobacteriota bacterium]|nr:polyprenyl synthetase family protein [Acidobacteriota bacterium]
MSNKIKDFFEASRKTIDRALERIIPDAETEPKKLHEAMRWSVFAGGKRFRPALVFAAGKTFGAGEEKLLKTAAAIEMIHAYSLIHDDLPAMDDDDLRRGRETCHIKFDEATAILAGDRLQAMAFQSIAADANLLPETRVRLVGELADAAAKMVDGQHLDLEAEGKTISIKELEAIHRNKTGALISAAACTGAIIAGASEKQLEAVSDYARSLGLLFQITDDLLDVTQTTEILGKTAGKDVSAEKATYPALYGIAETRALAAKVQAEAIAALNRIDAAKDTGLLRDLVDYILHREA